MTGDIADALTDDSLEELFDHTVVPTKRWSRLMPKVKKQQATNSKPKLHRPSTKPRKGVKKKVVKKASRGAGVLDRITPLHTGGNIKLNLYGRSGTGKTTFWATFPKPILAIICSNSAFPGELKSIDTPEYRKTISQVVLEKTSEVLELVDYCHQHPKEFATVVLDHASGLQEYVLKELLQLEEVPAQLS